MGEWQLIYKLKNYSLRVVEGSSHVKTQVGISTVKFERFRKNYYFNNLIYYSQ